MVDDESDLDAHFQSNLHIDRHITTICAKVNRIVGIIKHTFFPLNVEMFRIWLTSLMSLILQYCSHAWNLYTKVSARKLNKSSVRLLK